MIIIINYKCILALRPYTFRGISNTVSFWPACLGILPYFGIVSVNDLSLYMFRSLKNVLLLMVNLLTDFLILFAANS